MWKDQNGRDLAEGDNVAAYDQAGNFLYKLINITKFGSPCVDENNQRIWEQLEGTRSGTTEQIVVKTTNAIKI